MYKNAVEIDDIPSKDFKTLTTLIGLENALRVAQVFGGEYVYVPKKESIAREARNKDIRDAFNGANYKELGHKYNLSSKTIRWILDGQRWYKQDSLFGGEG